MSDRVTRSRRETLERYKEITKTKNESQAIDALATAKWDLAKALESFEGVSSDVELKSVSDTESSYSTESEASSGSYASSSSSTASSKPSTMDMSIASTVTVSSNDIMDVEFSSEPDTRAAMINGNSMNAEEATRRFAANFRTRYGAEAPNFFVGSLRDAVRRAFDAPDKGIMDRKPLAVYLYNDGAIGANIFAGGVMCSKDVSTLLNDNFILWPWDVTLVQNKEKLFDWMRELHMEPVVRNTDRLKVDFYPVLAILRRRSGVISIADKATGGASVGVVVNKLKTETERSFQANLRAFQVEQDRIERERLRQQQAAEYERSLAADQAKMQKAKEEREKVELEQKMKEEAEAMALHEAEVKNRRRAEILASLPLEPPLSDTNVIVVRLRFPGGELKNRRFRQSDHLKLLLAFVESEGFFMEQYRVWNSDRPKRDVTTFDAEKTFAELNWPRREIVYVDEK